jgi:hypothetical protein
MLAPLRACRSPLRATLSQSGAQIRRGAHPVRYFASTSPPEYLPPKRSTFIRRTATFARYSGYLILSSAFGVLAIGAGIFMHDAFTYADKHVDRVPINPLALNPEKGGPNNLPVVEVLVDDEDDEENRKLAEKPKLVIVGGGWGVSFIRTILSHHIGHRVNFFAGCWRSSESEFW